MSDFIVGGAVPPASRAYVPREFEAECFSYLTSAQADWVLLLGPRQTGKTSGLLRLRDRLASDGYAVAWIDMQAFGGSGGYAELLAWLARRVASAIGGPPPIVSEGQEDDLEAWIAIALDGFSGSIALIVDEAAAVPTEWRQRFYGQLRALFNARGSKDSSDPLSRLTFVFSGTFRPDLLIDSDNSPFNVSKDVSPDDFSLEQTRVLARDVAGDWLAPYADRAYELVGGQPYLVQSLLNAVAPYDGDEDRDSAFEREYDRIRMGKDRHLPSLFERVLADRHSADAVAELLAAGESGVAFSGTNAQHSWLETLGVAVEKSGRLVFRNPLYRDFAAQAPQLRPAGVSTVEAQEQVTEDQAQLLLHPAAELFDCVEDEQLRAIAIGSASASVDAYNGGHPRLALSGLGAALEAVLLSFLEHLETSKLSTAKAAVAADKRPNGAPSTWTLEQMSLVAHETDALPSRNQPLSSAVRDWRNLIHPAKARKEWRDEDDLKLEVQVAVGIFQMVLRDLGVPT